MAKDKTVEVRGYESALTGMSEEQFKEIRDKAVELSEEPAINLAISSGIASCRLYVVARMSLQRLLGEKGIEWKEGIEEMFLKVIDEKAQEPFALEELKEQLKNHIALFMEDELDQTTKKEITDGEGKN